MDPKADMDQLEQLVEGLRIKYLLYFSGRSPFEPLQYRWQVEAMIRRMQNERMTNTALVNRLRSLVQKMGNYSALWNRTRTLRKRNRSLSADREIEAALDKEGALESTSGASGEPVAEEPEDASLVEEMALAAEEAFASLPDEEDVEDPPSEMNPPVEMDPPEQVFSFLVPDPVDALYEQFVEAKNQTGEPVAGFSLEGFRKQIQGQQQALAERFPDREFKFVVVTNNGKASIKAVPRKQKD